MDKRAGLSAKVMAMTRIVILAKAAVGMRVLDAGSAVPTQTQAFVGAHAQTRPAHAPPCFRGRGRRPASCAADVAVGVGVVVCLDFVAFASSCRGRDPGRPYGTLPRIA